MIHIMQGRCNFMRIFSLSLLVISFNCFSSSPCLSCFVFGLLLILYFTFLLELHLLPANCACTRLLYPGSLRPFSENTTDAIFHHREITFCCKFIASSRIFLSVVLSKVTGTKAILRVTSFSVCEYDVNIHES